MTLRILTHPDSAPMAISLEMAREWLEESSPQDRRLKSVIEEATATGESHSPGSWVYREYTEEVTLSRSTRLLYLQARPVQEVVSVSFNGDPLDEAAGDFEVLDDGLTADTWMSGFPGWTVRYFGGYWLPASMGIARSSFAGTVFQPGAPVVDGLTAEGATSMSIRGGLAEETIVSRDAFVVEGVPGSFRFVQGAVATGGAIAAPPGEFFSPAAPEGGFPDGAPLTITHGEQSIDREGLHLRRAVWQTVQRLWSNDWPDKEGCGSRDSKPLEQIIPPAALATFWNEGPVAL